MRYIRTKDGRIIDSTKVVTGSKYMDFATNDESFKAIFQTEPLDKADSIDELCDEFTYEYNKYSKHERCWRDSNPDIWYDYYTDTALNEEEISTIKGAIWTDKGLIYVAKMNDKGILESL